MATLIQRAFSAGEISPSLYARVDQIKYQTGLRTCRNFIIARHGGAYNRPGTKFVCEVKDSTKSTRTINFEFNADQTYIIEMGDQYMRFIRNGAQITESAQNITGVTQADPGVVTITSHGYSNGDEVFISGVGGMTQLNNRNFKVANVTANTFELQDMTSTDLDTSGYTAYTSVGTAAKVYEISTPYLEADLFDVHFVQSADIITLTHPDYAPRELARTGHTSWTLTQITFAPDQDAPTSPAVNGGSGSESWTYHITAINGETFEESLAATATDASSDDPGTTAHTITWSNPSSGAAFQYNIYAATGGSIPGFIGVSDGNSFTNSGLDIDTTDNPPTARNPFGNDASDDCPSTVSYFQQRLMFANTNNNPEKVWSSRTGQFKNFTISAIAQDDDAVTFTMAGRQVNSVENLVDIGKLMVMTAGGEWSADGDDSGILRPTAVNLRQHSYSGSSNLQPIVIGGSIIFVQARQSIVRDLGFDFEVDGYRGNDLTVFSSHLFDRYTLIQMAYQQIPNSNLWFVRDDGGVVGCTLVREQQMLAWHRHDFQGGNVKSVSTISEGNENTPYFVIERTINGRTTKYIERFSTRQVDPDAIEDAIFMDSSLSYDGTNATATTMTISGGTNWTYDELLTLTHKDSGGTPAAYFAATDVGNAIHVTGSDGSMIRFTISAYTSSTVVTGFAHKTVPASLQSTATSTWAKAVDQLGGLWHIEGEDVSVFGDGFVVGSPNNSAYETVTVSNGTVTLDRPYSVVHVGLPYLSDLETLNLDSANGETLIDKKMIVKEVTLSVEASRGIWAGTSPPSSDATDPTENLRELKIRENETYDQPVSLTTDNVDIIVAGEWNSNGRVFVRQIDPVPLSVLSVAPQGDIPLRR